MGAVLDVRPEVRTKVYVDDNKFNVQAERAEEASRATRKAYEELMKFEKNKVGFGRRRKEGRRVI